MRLLLLLSSILISVISTVYFTPLFELFRSFSTSTTTAINSQAIKATLESPQSSMSTASAAKNTMSKLAHAKIVPRLSSARGHAVHKNFLDTYHTFSFADYYDSKFQHFGCLRVLNEDRVEAGSGFPTHPHRDAEIFSYILSGELTHRDSMIKKGQEGEQGDKFYRMKRGDVQFTTGGTGNVSFHAVL